MKHFKLFLLPLSICVLPLSTPARYAPGSNATLGPCTCFWDNSTKIYPDNAVTLGPNGTTVKYTCGYVCLDRLNRPSLQKADHAAFYSGEERGDEVVCDGLSYVPQEPNEDFGGRVIYMWDGLTHAFDARKSDSANVRAWSKKACEGIGKIPKKNSVVSPEQIKKLREQI